MRFAFLLAFTLPLVAQEPLLRLPPAHTTVEIAHQPVLLSASGAIYNGAAKNSYALSLAVDLSDLQAHVTEILRAQLDRSEQCGDRIALQHATLLPGPPGALLTAEMHVERWVCVKALGKAVNKRLVGGNAIVTVALRPVTEASSNARLEAEVRNVQADGSLGELLSSGPLGDMLREKIRSSVQSALDKATDFHATLPPQLQDAVKLRSLAFSDTGGGKLALTLAAEATISSAQLQELRSLKPRP